jgi:hypothetical protein
MTVVDGYDDIGRDIDAIGDALDVVRDIAGWRMAEPNWARVEQQVVALTDAVRGGDPRTLRQAITGLELLAPSRVTRIGAIAYGPAPPRVRTLTDNLVHHLTTAARERAAAPGVDPSPDRGANGERQHTD